jgi:hypothetical protein
MTNEQMVVQTNKFIAALVAHKTYLESLSEDFVESLRGYNVEGVIEDIEHDIFRLECSLEGKKWVWGRW